MHLAQRRRREGLFVKRSKDPGRRYQSAQEVEIALANYIDEQEDRAKEKKRKRLPVAAAVGLPLVAVLTALALYLFYFNEKAPPPTVLSDIVAYQHKCEPEPWPALQVHDIDDVPDPDYSGFEVRVDSRFWDLSKWHRSANAEKDPELSFMTRIMEVKRRPGQASNGTLPFHTRVCASASRLSGSAKGPAVATPRDCLFLEKVTRFLSLFAGVRSFLPGASFSSFTSWLPTARPGADGCMGKEGMNPMERLRRLLRGHFLEKHGGAVALRREPFS